MAYYTNRQILLAILRGVYHMSQEMDRLTASVAASTTVVGSAEAMLHGFVEQMRNAQDPAAVNALADEIDANTARLAAAIAANTPAAAEVPPTV